MAQAPISDELAIQALNWEEEYGSGYLASKALGDAIPHKDTIAHRARVGRLRGLRPTFRKDAPRIYTKQRLGKMHIVLPDVQARPGVNTDHLEHIGNYVAEKKPDEFICIGDFADLPSIGTYDKGTLKAEGRRYNKDVDAARAAMARLMAPIEREQERCPWPMRKTMTRGNHEERAEKIVNLMPELEGTISPKDLGYEDWGWEVHPFLKVVKIDGIEYAHYFTSGVMGRPVSSAAALLRERQSSATMGHVQHTDIAMHKKTQNIALFCGTAYTHDEDYLGPQGNSQRRQIIVKHEVDGHGHYDLMLVSLAFLAKAYS